jgi:riboflavin synthase
MAGLSAILIVAGAVGLTEVNTASAIAASAFAIIVGIVGAKHAITQ